MKFQKVTNLWRILMLPAGFATAALLANPALGIPTIEDYADFVEIRDGKKQLNSDLMYKDNSDSKIVYVPYDRIELVKDPQANQPAFSFVFNEEAGVVTFTIKAGYSAERKAAMQEMRNQGLKVKPLAPIGGGWVLGVVGKSVSFSVNGTAALPTVLPDVPVSLQLKLDKTEIGLLVQAFKTGANVSVNYVYQFRGALTPFWIRASVNWSSFRSFLQEQTIINTQSCSSGQSRGWFSSASSKACSNGWSNIRDVVRSAVQHQVVRIVSLQSGTEAQERAIDEITKMIISKQFKPMDATWEPIDPTPPSTVCEVGGSGNYDARCSSKASSYVYNREIINENRSEDYYIQSQGVMTLPAAVGGSLNALCESYPKLFIHSRTGAQGCPTTWDDSGIKQPSTGGPAPVQPAVVLPEDRLQPPVLFNF